MTDPIYVTGMVISSSPVGENDKRVLILTKERGKISAFARGVRRQGSHLMAACESFAFGTFSLICGRDAYVMTGAKIGRYFRELTQDIAATYSAYYFLELAEYYAVENEDGGPMLNLIYAAFLALLNPKLDNRLVRHIYELKMLVLNGEYPQFFCCVGCENKERLTRFSVSGNGMLCAGCAGQKPASDSIALSESALYALQFIVRTDTAKLFSFAVSEEVLTELRMTLKRCMRNYVDRKMNSLEILDGIS